MKKLENASLRRLLLGAIGLGVTLLTLSTNAQTPPTGTRIESAGNTSSVKVIQLDEPGEFIQIRRLLTDKKIDEALELALAYVQRVEKSGKDLANRYYARNALCVVYTHAREASLAEEECTNAVELMPSHWSAWNNRGTARYLAGNMTDAKADYLQALEVAGNKKDTKELLQHNIALVDQQSK